MSQGEESPTQKVPNMKVREGRPTKKAINDLCGKHGLFIYALDTYVGLGHVVFSDRHGANDKAKGVVAELQSHGFTVTLREAKSSVALTGCICIIPKKEQ